MGLKRLETFIFRRLDIRVTFALLCTAILLLVMSFSPSLFSRARGTSTQVHKYSNLWDEEESHLDIHLEGPERGHYGADHGKLHDIHDSVVSKTKHSHKSHDHRKSNRTTIAVGLAITARDQEFLTIDNVPYRTPFLKTLVPSFCKTASLGFEYHFYVAFDMEDPYLSREEYLRAIFNRFQEVVKQLCPSESSFFLHFVQCNHNRSPSWAQNDAMMEAYLDNMDFYYRVNDDTQMMSPGWTEPFIDGLKNFNPPFVGVVGPVHKGGNEVILTYDFVHRTHIDVFGYYYPRLFTDWWADNWMTQVYGEQRTLKLPSVRVMHTLEAGTRYKVQYDISKLVQYQLLEDTATLNRYLRSRTTHEPQEQDAPTRVISMSLWGSEPRYTYGALRNAQLVPVYFRGWRLRIYVEQPLASGKTVHKPVPQRILDKLLDLGAEVLYVNAQQSHIPPMMWRFLAADDLSVESFIVRDADTRLSDRDAIVVQEWIKSGHAFHCVRDHPSHTQYALLGGLWGAKPAKLKEVFAIPWQDLMIGYTTDYVMDMTFLANAVWPKVKKLAYCHDSVSCETWPSAHPFPLARVKAEHLGQVFDAFGNPRDNDVRSIMERPPNVECFTNKYNVSSLVGDDKTGASEFMGLTFEEDGKMANRDQVGQLTNTSASRHIPLITASTKHLQISHSNFTSSSVVVWSVDFHSGPIRDIKSILLPMQVRFLDQSFSSKCMYAQNCATKLRVINKKNGITLGEDVKEKFFMEYESDPEMNLVTHFLCTHPVSLCELYLKFGKPIIIYATHRYEMGRYGREEWQSWNSHLVEIAQNAENTVAASNKYDAAYIEYFTGISPTVIPLFCKYVNAHYKPTKPTVLLAPLHNPTFEEDFFLELTKAKRQNSSFTSDILSLSQLYPEYTFQDVASHVAVIHIPYQVSTMTLCEHYYMNIPLFVPTLDLLIDWHLKYNLLSAITFNTVRALSNGPQDRSPLPGKNNAPDPNKIHDRQNLEHWLRLADFYQKKHLVYFSSVTDLLVKLQSTNLMKVSERMSDENKRDKVHIVDHWKKVFKGI